jgi:hypothetical protein
LLGTYPHQSSKLPLVRLLRVTQPGDTLLRVGSQMRRALWLGNQVEHGDTERYEPQYGFDAARLVQSGALQFPDMLDVSEGFLNLEPMVVDLDDLLLARLEVIGQDVPRLLPAPPLGRTDDAQSETVQLDRSISGSQVLDLDQLPVQLDVAVDSVN